MKKLIDNIKGWIFSIRMLRLSTRNRVTHFWGFGHWRYAKKYARRRHDMDGKRYYVAPAGPGVLIVFNSLEMKGMKRLGILRKGVEINIATLLRDAYYYVDKNTRNAKKSKKSRASA